MAALGEAHGDRVASAMAVPTGGCCRDLFEVPVGKLSPASTSGSTRASSPGSASATSEDASCGSLSPCLKPHGDSSTLAQRRGIRTAILGDLGVELDATTLSGTCSSIGSPAAVSNATTPFGSATPRMVYSPAHLTSTRPGPMPRTPFADASQRSPVLPRGVQSPVCKNRIPKANSRLSRDFLGSSPGSTGDASQRKPAGNWMASPVAATSWSSAASTVEATRVAAMASAGACGIVTSSTPAPSPLSCAVPAIASGAVVVVSFARTVAPMSPHVGALLGSFSTCPSVAQRDSSCHQLRASSGGNLAAAEAADGFTIDGAMSPSVGSKSALDQLLAGSGLASLSSEDVAARLRAAAPEEYED